MILAFLSTSALNANTPNFARSLSSDSTVNNPDEYLSNFNRDLSGDTSSFARLDVMIPGFVLT